ncbi:MAG: hypothetical protein KIS90_04705, partial [Phenylobacterium sp.]|nr:hypothetical protein [Phenylobacterium sp.]
MAAALSIAATPAVSAPAHASKVGAGKVCADCVKATMQRLVAPDMKGRACGTAEENAAARWLADRLKAYHAKGAAPDLEQSDTARPSPEQLLEMARACEAASLAIPEIATSGGGGASSEPSIFAYATSNGFEGAEASTSYR